MSDEDDKIICQKIQAAISVKIETFLKYIYFSRATNKLRDDNIDKRKVACFAADVFNINYFMFDQEYSTINYMEAISDYVKKTAWRDEIPEFDDTKLNHMKTVLPIFMNMLRPKLAALLERDTRTDNFFWLLNCPLMNGSEENLTDVEDYFGPDDDEYFIFWIVVYAHISTFVREILNNSENRKPASKLIRQEIKNSSKEDELEEIWKRLSDYATEELLTKASKEEKNRVSDELKKFWKQVVKNPFTEKKKDIKKRTGFLQEVFRQLRWWIAEYLAAEKHKDEPYNHYVSLTKLKHNISNLLYDQNNKAIVDIPFLFEAMDVYVFGPCIGMQSRSCAFSATANKKHLILDWMWNDPEDAITHKIYNKLAEVKEYLFSDKIFQQLKLSLLNDDEEDAESQAKQFVAKLVPDNNSETDGGGNKWAGGYDAVTFVARWTNHCEDLKGDNTEPFFTAVENEITELQEKRYNKMITKHKVVCMESLYSLLRIHFCDSYFAAAIIAVKCKSVGYIESHKINFGKLKLRRKLKDYLEHYPMAATLVLVYVATLKAEIEAALSSEHDEPGKNDTCTVEEELDIESVIACLALAMIDRASDITETAIKIHNEMVVNGLHYKFEKTWKDLKEFAFKNILGKDSINRDMRNVNVNARFAEVIKEEMKLLEREIRTLNKSAAPFYLNYKIVNNYPFFTDVFKRLEEWSDGSLSNDQFRKRIQHLHTQNKGVPLKFLYFMMFTHLFETKLQKNQIVTLLDWSFFYPFRKPQPGFEKMYKLCFGLGELMLSLKGDDLSE